MQPINLPKTNLKHFGCVWMDWGLSYKSCRTSLSRILFWAQLYNVVYNNPDMPSPAQPNKLITKRRVVVSVVFLGLEILLRIGVSQSVSQVKNTLLSLLFALSLSLYLKSNHHSLSHKQNKKEIMTSLTELDDETVRTMSIGAVFSDFVGKINSIDFHRKEDLLVTASEDDSVRFYDIANAKLVKTTYHKKHGADRICFTHHPSSVICSSRYNLESTGESLRYLSMYDNRCLRYFKGHKERVVSLCMSPINDSFMSGSLDHSVRIWDLRVNACQGILRLRGRPTVAYDQQGLVFAVAMEGGAIKLFDSRSYDKGPFDTFLVGGDTAEVCDIKFSNDGKSMLLTTTNNNIYVLDAYGGEKRCGFSLEPSPTANIEATFTPDGQYVVSGSGDGTMHAWSINRRNEVASWNSHIGVASCLKWAPRRAMFVAASTVLTFWIPDNSKLNADPASASISMDTEAPTQSELTSQ